MPEKGRRVRWYQRMKCHKCDGWSGGVGLYLRLPLSLSLAPAAFPVLRPDYRLHSFWFPLRLRPPLARCHRDKNLRECSHLASRDVINYRRHFPLHLSGGYRDVFLAEEEKRKMMFTGEGFDRVWCVYGP